MGNEKAVQFCFDFQIFMNKSLLRSNQIVAYKIPCLLLWSCLPESWISTVLHASTLPQPQLPATVCDFASSTLSTPACQPPYFAFPRASKHFGIFFQSHLVCKQPLVLSYNKPMGFSVSSPPHLNQNFSAIHMPGLHNLSYSQTCQRLQEHVCWYKGPMSYENDWLTLIGEVSGCIPLTPKPLGGKLSMRWHR